MKKSLIAAIIVGSTVLNTACSSSRAEVEEGGVTVTSMQGTQTTIGGELATDEAASQERDRIAGDLQYALPSAEAAAEVFLPGVSGEYVVRREQPIGMDQQLWSWASGFSGGWERSYEMTTDVAGPERRIAVTTRVLMFESEELAIGFSKRLVDELGKAVEFTYENEYSPFEFTTSYKVPSDELAGKSGVASVYGSLMVWTTFEDSESSNVWSDSASSANLAVHAEIVKKYPDLKQ